MPKSAVQSINDVNKFLDEKSLLPIYFLYGEDSFAIESAVYLIQNKVEQFILSDFDKEIINAEKDTSLINIIDQLYAFPFGGGKKLLVIKNFDVVKDKKPLSDYINNPSGFSILILIYNGSLTFNELNKEPFSVLLNKNYLFEARVLKGEELVNWFISLAKKNNFELSQESTKTIIEIVGEEKFLLEMQLQKFINYSKGKNLSLNELIKLSSPTKQYSIFDLLNSLGKGDKAKSIEVSNNLIENGVELIAIINMISKFILTIANAMEFISLKVNDKEAAKKLGTSDYFYQRCKEAKFFLNNDRLHNASIALLNADLSVKSTSIDSKTILQILITELLTKANSNPFEQ